jgi:hypothetical protein
VLNCLAFNSDHAGATGVPQEVIAEQAEISISTVKRRIKFLEQCGVITVHRKQLGDQKRRNFYHLSLSTAFDLTGGSQTPVNLTGSSETPVDFSQVSGGHLEQPDRGQGELIQGSPVSHCSNYLNPSTYLDRSVTQTPVDRYVMTDDWTPVDPVFQVLISEGMPESWILDQLPDFRVYWIGRGTARDDFNNQFMNHCRFRSGDEKHRQGSSQQSKIKQLTDREWSNV